MTQNPPDPLKIWPVKIWEEIVVIPTYLPMPPDPNPMFFERRVYQGSSGKVYPLPFTDRLSGERKDKSYKAVFLENEYLRLMVLPELGGRVQIGLDKTNGYNFIYHNRVIKPALIGLAGPWISGGLEWNWPQHHRPTTFMPVDYTLEEGKSGSKTVWVGEIEPLFGMKGMAGITLHPGKSYFEARVRLYNATPLPQTFMWWANLGVHVNEHYQVLYPPDIDYVVDHARRAVTPFPATRESYYGADYSQGVDLSWYKNIPVSSSYMVLWSDFDFWGGYDHAKQAGVMHIADHHIAPGKKLFTWGTGDFGRSWCSNLTDEDGPYVELMTGAYTDNQPDFAWMQPFETKTFSQYWYPLRQTGQVKMANLNSAVNLDVKDNTASVRVNVTGAFPGARIILEQENLPLREYTTDLAPDAPFVNDVKLSRPEAPLSVVVLTAQGQELVRYAPFTPKEKPAPQPAVPPDPPDKIESLEKLYLVGLHLEQYRHPTIDPEPYYDELLRRDPEDARGNNARGLLYLRQGSFEQAIQHFQRAIGTLTIKNFNPYDGEPYYNLGLALRLAGRLSEAYDAFYKSIWSRLWQAAGYFALAELDSLAGQPEKALEHLERALLVDAEHLRARNLKTSLLRRAGHLEQAQALAQETIQLDRLDYASRFELSLILEGTGQTQQASDQLNALRQIVHDPASASLGQAAQYASAGLFDEAIRLLRELGITEQDRPALSTSPLLLRPSVGVKGKPTTNPLIFYHLAYYAGKQGKSGEAIRYAQLAAQMSPDYCFPSLLESVEALRYAQKINPQDGRAPYYLGNLFYDKKRYHEAIEQWEWSLALSNNSSASDAPIGNSPAGGKNYRAIVQRNLGMAYYNIEKNPQKALLSYQAACQANPKDARLFFELDQLQKFLGAAPEERLAQLERRLDLVEQRDDLSIERISLYNLCGDYDQALDLLAGRTFRPWEGGEGRVSHEYILAHLQRGVRLLEANQPKAAITDFQATLVFPANLGEARYAIWQPEADLDYFLGCAYQAQSDTASANQYFEKVIAENKPQPEIAYYQGLALQKLDRPDEAEGKFAWLRQAGARWLASEGFQTFRTSVPTLTVLNDDPAAYIQKEGHYWLGLGWMGSGKMDDAVKEFARTLQIDPCHAGAKLFIERIQTGKGNLT
jgi:tetratricopeptide (TPR) repeat protein